MCQLRIYIIIIRFALICLCKIRLFEARTMVRGNGQPVANVMRRHAIARARTGSAEIVRSPYVGQPAPTRCPGRETWRCDLDTSRDTCHSYDNPRFLHAWLTDSHFGSRNRKDRPPNVTIARIVIHTNILYCSRNDIILEMKLLLLLPRIWFSLDSSRSDLFFCGFIAWEWDLNLLKPNWKPMTNNVNYY